jgi:hypothetical protein
MQSTIIGNRFIDKYAITAPLINPAVIHEQDRSLCNNGLDYVIFKIGVHISFLLMPRRAVIIYIVFQGVKVMKFCGLRVSLPHHSQRILLSFLFITVVCFCFYLCSTYCSGIGSSKVLQSNNTSCLSFSASS